MPNNVNTEWIFGGGNAFGGDIPGLPPLYESLHVRMYAYYVRMYSCSHVLCVFAAHVRRVVDLLAGVPHVYRVVD